MSLQGTLKTLGIAEVLEFLASRSSTGRLDIESESGGATYWLLRGEVAEVNYDFERESGTDAAEATYYALAEVEGTFLFDEEQVPDTTANTESVADILARTAAAADGWSDVEKTVPSPDHFLVRSNQIDGSVTIEPAWWNAIQAIGDGSTTRRLSKELDLRSLDTSRMVADMARNGLILVEEPRSQQPEGAAVAEPTVEVTSVAEELIVEEPVVEEPVIEVEMVQEPDLEIVATDPEPVDAQNEEFAVEPAEVAAHMAPVEAPAPDDVEPLAEVTPIAAEKDSEPTETEAPVLEASPFESPALNPMLDADGRDYEAMTAELEQSPVDTLASIAEALAAEGPLTLPEDAAAPGADVETPAEPVASPFDSPVSNPFSDVGSTPSASPWDNAPPVGEQVDSWPETPDSGAAPAIAWESPTPDSGMAADWSDDDDEGWATDHSTPVTPVPQPDAVAAQNAPAPADPFNQVPAPEGAFADVASPDVAPAAGQPAPPTAEMPEESVPEPTSEPTTGPVC